MSAYVTPAALAARLRCSKGAVLAGIARGELRGAVRIGRAWAIPAAAAKAWRPRAVGWRKGRTRA